MPNFGANYKLLKKLTEEDCPRDLNTECESNSEISIMVLVGVEVVPINGIKARRGIIVIATLILKLHAFMVVRGKCHIPAALP
jgi:hypothetical protein